MPSSYSNANGISTYNNSISISNQNQCDRCYELFDDLDDLEDHKEECDAPLEDNIPTNIFGNHICPICQKKYITANFLGEHFIIAHSEYSDLTKLDIKEKIYHPGFDVMIHIGLIEPFRQREVDDLIENQEECIICFDKYKYSSPKKSYLDDDRKTLPCITQCCQRHLCRDCLEKHVGYSNKLKCPYCKKDYENVDYEYVIVYEDSNITNGSWRQWWEKHLDIFE